MVSCAGLPVSTTQTITGALLAIGLMEGLKGVNWRSVGRVSTFPCPYFPTFLCIAPCNLICLGTDWSREWIVLSESFIDELSAGSS